MGRRTMLALLVALALCGAAPMSAQVRRPAERAAKKGIVEQRRAGGPNAEDFIMRLVEQPPERRREMLANNPRFQNLPAPQRRRILDRLEQIDAMEPAEREQLIERYHLFSRLAPEKRERARQLYQQWVKIPGPKRQMMTRAVARIRRMNAALRPAAIESPQMTERFNEQERKLIAEIAELAPGPAGDR